MSAPIASIEYEPFGQRGIRELVRPTLTILCAVGIAVAIALQIRSQQTYDVLWKTYDTHRLEVGSAMGRLMLTARPLRRPAAPDTWSYESYEIRDMSDGWVPSIWKSIGIDWGQEQQPIGWSGRVATYWRMRVKWTSLAVVFATPLAIEALRSRRTRVKRPAANGPKITAV